MYFISYIVLLCALTVLPFFVILKQEKKEWEKTSPEVQVMQLQVVRKKYERMANELKAKLEVVERRIKDKNTEDVNESAET